MDYHSLQILLGKQKGVYACGKEKSLVGSTMRPYRGTAPPCVS